MGFLFAFMLTLLTGPSAQGIVAPPSDPDTTPIIVEVCAPGDPDTTPIIVDVNGNHAP